MKIIGIIPARYGSSRYRGKPLCDILGKPMILRVYESANKWKKWYKLYVATDDKRITDCCDKYNIPWIMTDINHKDCIDRCAETADILKEKGIEADRYIIIQGDEPLFNVDTLDIDYTEEVINFYKDITDKIEIDDINIVKVLVTKDENALYFSRYPLPYVHQTTRKIYKNPIYNKQIGVYIFSYEYLKKYIELGPSELENQEGIGLNRFLENDIKIKMKYTRHDSVSVDTISDKYKVENILEKNELIHL